ncbi:RCC1 and BTB domain-containing protein 1-like, partial [Ceratina calcarata]|uniref:RCC1 and BTB domain-containing protein 1-like n=1 Tax=Ceratina calcarata TaxID=156304 RepID=A0AAJ7IXN4_9HYME
CLYVWGANDHGQLGIPHIRSIKRTPSVSKPQKLKQPKMGRVYDIATCWCQNMSVAMSDTNRIFIWGYCVDKDINVPTLTSLRCLQDSFAFYSSEIYCHLLIVNDEKETNVMDSMEEAFDDASTSDLIIQVHGKPIHVHKVVLKIRSHYFRTMFQEHWTENSQSVIKHEQYSYDVYKSFLKYLYTNEVADLPQEDALELSILAEAYSEDLLKRRCLQMIRNKITVENVLLFYDASMKHNFKELEEYCFKFATYHLTDVVQTASFAKLNESCIKTFITEAAKAGTFNTE